MNKPSQHPTLRDVARRAGVSPSSASRVLNDRGAMSEYVRAQVLEAAEAVGYRPRRRGARRLEGEAEKVGLVALLITETLNPYFHEIVQGAQEEAERNDLLSVVLYAAPEAKRERVIARTLAELQLCGVILCAGQLATPSFLAFFQDSQVPLVVINRRVTQPHVPCLVVDYELAANRATQHLLSLGHRQIGYLSGGLGTTEISQARQCGMEAALAAQGLSLRPDWIVPGFNTITGGFQAMSTLLQIPEADRPTAVIAYNDLVAIGAMNAARAAGQSVPEDLSLVGFDDIPMAAYTNPPLTTIGIPKYHIGQLAVQTLSHMSAGAPASGGYTQVEGSLIVRDSTAPPHRRLG